MKNLDEDSFKEEPLSELLLINKVLYQKQYIIIDLIVHNEFAIENAIALIDNGANMNYIEEELVQTQYFEKTTQTSLMLVREI